MNLQKEGAIAHTELYGLLHQAELKFGQAVIATVNLRVREATDPGIEAGLSIFGTTLNALSHYHWVGNLPLIEDAPLAPSDEAILPPPILVALAYFLDTAQTVCLRQWQLSSGQAEFDTAILFWPNTLLWSLSAKTRFFYDLSEYYASTPVENPLLSHNRIRAVQLLVVGRHLIKKEVEKIGLPTEYRVLLP